MICSSFRRILIVHSNKFIMQLSSNIKHSKKKDYIFKLIKKYVNIGLSDYDVLILLNNLYHHDKYTVFHCLNTGVYCLLFSLLQGIDNEKFLVNICKSGFLHDIGKLKIPISVINKPTRLTKSEFSNVKNHPTYGLSIVKNSPNKFDEDVLLGIGEHHEKFNGLGYPYGKTQISLPGQIVCQSDNIDALKSTRAYKESWNKNQILNYMTDNVNIMFTPNSVDNFHYYFIS